MADAHRLLEFVGLALVLILVPGPSVLFVIGRAVSYGRRAAVATVAGNCAGVGVQIVAVAVGLGTVVAQSVAAFTVVKLAGAAYLVWLGWQSFRHRRQLAARAAPNVDVAPIPLRRMVRDGFVVGVANPKAIVFFVAVLPQFVDGDGWSPVAQMMVLGLMFEAVAFVSDSAWGLAAGTARTWLSRKPRRLAAVGGAGGLAVMGLGVRLALSGRE